MFAMRKWHAGCLFVCFTVFGCQAEKSSTPAVAQATPQELAELSVEFRQRIDKVADGVWMAIGYGLANSILIEGDGGLIVIDTMEALETRTSRLFSSCSSLREQRPSPLHLLHSIVATKLTFSAIASDR